MGIGGTEQVIFQLVNHADKTLFENSIACIEGEIGPIGQKLRESGTRFHTLQRVPGFDINLIKSVRALLTDKKIDIIHCHQYTPYVYGVLAAFFHNTKVVFTEHGRFHPDRHSWKRRLINPLLGMTTTAITAISAATKEALAHHEWFRKSAIQVVYNGIESTEVPSPSRQKNELGLTEDHIVFGTITRFDQIKNLPMMITAFSKVYEENSHARLLLVGDGDQRSAAESLVASLSLDKAVIFTGFQTDTKKYMSMIDVYVLSSFSEGTSMTLLEAMSFSTCSVVTAVGGNVEIIKNNENGFVVESENTDQLANTMRLLSNNPELRQKMGKAAKATFSRKFALDQMVQSYKKIYLSSVKRASHTDL